MRNPPSRSKTFTDKGRVSNMREVSYKDAIHDALVDEMRRDPKVILIGEDIGAFGGLTDTTIGIIDEFGPSG